MTSTPTGYSGTPLFKKLGIKSNCRLCVINPPIDYQDLIAPIPDNVSMLQRVGKDMDIIHFFSTSRQELERKVKNYILRIKPNGMIWISWPKKASKVPTDITEDVIRDVVLPLGLVDVKVCAVDAVWSGLKLVIRKELRDSR